MSDKRNFRDQLGRQLNISFPPKRIISLVPSQTELLFHLGLGEQIVGLTKFCVHPLMPSKAKTQVGGTKNLHLDRIRDLQPDLIIANKEENEQEQIEALEKEFPVWISDVRTLEGALEMISGVGDICDKKQEAKTLVNEIALSFKDLKQSPPRRVAYFIWRNPYIVVGGDTFINDMLRRCGFVNVFEAAEGRYPEVTEEQLKEADAEWLFLSSEPFPFKETHIEELRDFLPQAKMRLVDGEVFSWYGSRLLQAVPYLNSLIERLSH